MQRLVIYLLLSITCIITSRAETVSQKQAHQMARLFFNAVYSKITAPPKLVYNGKKLTTGRLFTPFYVYNNSLGGFVIISAENKAFPILGYSLKQTFNPDQLGYTELALLRQYAYEIEMIRYNSEPVDEARRAWENYEDYIRNLLTAQYHLTDPQITMEETLNAIEVALEKDDAIYSELYTPSQWQEMIMDELKLKETVPVAFISENQVYPAAVYGWKGDYFRIDMDCRNDWFMRMNATEVIPCRMVSILNNRFDYYIDAQEEPAFDFQDSFLNEVSENEFGRTTKSSIDRPAIETAIQIMANGSGHFEIHLNENISIVRIYNLIGALVGQYTFRDTNIGNIDISGDQSGFYFVSIISESGRPYGLKIFR